MLLAFLLLFVAAACAEPQYLSNPDDVEESIHKSFRGPDQVVANRGLLNINPSGLYAPTVTSTSTSTVVCSVSVNALPACVNTGRRRRGIQLDDEEDIEASQVQS